MLYLFRNNYNDIPNYCDFVSRLAEKYFIDVYLVEDNLNTINTPNPGSFDKTILNDRLLDTTPFNRNLDFTAIYGDGTQKTKGISLFVFNYLDYKLWEKYANELRGKKTKASDDIRTQFFIQMGCSDFGLKVFLNSFIFREHVEA